MFRNHEEASLTAYAEEVRAALRLRQDKEKQRWTEGTDSSSLGM